LKTKFDLHKNKITYIEHMHYYQLIFQIFKFYFEIEYYFLNALKNKLHHT
jgi:hypothetical protein